MGFKLVLKDTKPVFQCQASGSWLCDSLQEWLGSVNDSFTCEVVDISCTDPYTGENDASGGFAAGLSMGAFAVMLVSIGSMRI